MKTALSSNRLAVLIGGACFAVMALLLVIAYIPSFAPAAYDKFRRSGLIAIVPIITAIGTSASVAWLWCIHKEDADNVDILPALKDEDSKSSG